jgi:CheY-like chemotaxis protein
MNLQVDSTPAEGVGSCGIGRATILVVENHACLRKVARVILERCGYRVLTAANGHVAKRVLREESGINLILTDFEFQDMSGQELARWCQARRPDVQIVFMSDTPGRSCERGSWAVEMPFIHIDILIKTVRDALNSVRVSRMMECAA